MVAANKGLLNSTSKRFRIFLAVVGALGTEFISGTIEGQAAVLLPQLETSTKLPITREQASWIASMGALLCPFTSILCGPLMDLLGRRLIFRIFYTVSTLGYLIIALANEVWHLYIGRLCLAFSLGFMVANVIYLPEITTTKQRSTILSFLNPLFNLGLLFGYSVGGYIIWDRASLIQALVCSAGLVTTAFLPESPAWLVKKKRHEEARRVYKRLGRNAAKIDADIYRLELTADGESVKSSIPLRLFLHPTVWKPFLILAAFHFLQAMTGIYNLAYYTVGFFANLGPAFDPISITVSLAFAKFVICVTFGTYLTTKCRRRMATAVSGFGAGIAYLFAVTYEWYFFGIAARDRQLQWIPVAAVVVSSLISTAGVGALPWIMTGELYPLSIRGVMGGATFFVGNAFLFLTVKFHLDLMDALGMMGILILFAIACMVSGAFGLLVLPETQGKTMLEIERGFLKQEKPQMNMGTCQDVEESDEAYKQTKISFIEVSPNEGDFGHAEEKFS